MRWRKIGPIFDPAKHRLPNRCAQFAQSPQALDFDDFVRIYFSTREFEVATQKYLSHVAYVDFAKDMKTILRTSAKTVLPLGELGCFDEHGIFPFHVMNKDGEIYAYTCGWSRRTSVSVETSIGLAMSKDQGETFQRFGNGPVLTSSLREPFLVGDAFVREYEGCFHMWYIFGTAWKRYEGATFPDRTYKIGHTTSQDGIRWTKAEEGRRIISDALGEDECQALPTVIENQGGYHMIFCYRHSSDFRKNVGRGYRLGYAHSPDLVSWTREDDKIGIEPSAEGWDSQMQCYPHLFRCDDTVYLLYNGNEFGRGGFGLAVLEEP